MWNIGIVCGTTDDPYTNGLVEGAASVAREGGGRLVAFYLVDVPPRPSWTTPFTEGRELVEVAGLDGLLISAQLSHAKSKEEFAAFCHSTAPLPRVTLSVRVEGLPAVVPAVEGQMRELMRHLLDDHGYTRLAYIGGPPGQQEAEGRKAIFLDELARRGLTAPPEWLVSGDFRQRSGSEAARQIWSTGHRPQGIVAANDNMAMGALEFVRSQGLRVPQDCFVTGIDDINVYGLTTIGQSPFLLAAEGARTLLRLLEGKPVEPLVWSEAHFRRRSSCGCTGFDPEPAVKGAVGYASSDRHSLFELLRSLRSPFTEALSKGESAGFHQAVASNLVSTIASIPIEEWMATLLQLQKDVPGALSDLGSKYLLDAHAQVASTYLENATTVRILRELEVEMADDLTQILAEARTMDQIVDALVRQCPPLGMYSFVLALAEPKEAGLGSIRQLLALGPQGRIPLSPTRGGQPLRKVMEESGRWLSLFPGRLDVLALFGQNGLLGYCLTSGEERHTISRSTFRAILSGAIEHVRLWQDWTEATQHLLHSEKMASLGSLVAGVAHEVNTPLGIAFTTATDLLSRTEAVEKLFEEGNLAKSGFNEYLARAKEESRLIEQHLARAASIVQSFKRVAVDQSHDVYSEFDLKTCLSDVLLSLAYPLKRGGHRVVLRCAEGIRLVGHPGSLVQVLTNLVMNSLVHGFEGREGGTVTVEAEVVAEAVELHYQDDGCGLSPEAEARVFEPFFTTKRGQGGTGLGLNLVKNVLQTVWSGTVAYQPRQGGGAHFILRLPTKARGGGPDVRIKP